MNIQDAKSEGGKAIVNGRVAYEDFNGILRWSGEGTLVMLKDITRTDWQPYPDEKVIRPEKVGEKWLHEKGGSFYTHSDSYEEVPVATMTTNHFGVKESLPRKIIHNQGGWQRIDPPVEDV